MNRSPESAVSLTPVGVVRSCFTEKFGIPRQPGLIREARADVEIFPPYDADEAFRGLQTFSHIWLLYVFHASVSRGWRPTVRPPRLGGNRRIGVFASRSPFRPNPVGMSAVRLEGVSRKTGTLTLKVAGVDLLDGTPVLDIKPYLPYADGIPEARADMADDPPEKRLEVCFSESAESVCRAMEESELPGLRALIEEILSYDPRPAYSIRNPDKVFFGMRLYRLDIRWEISGKTVRVVSAAPAAGGRP